MGTRDLSPRSLAVALSLVPGIGSRTITRVLTRNELIGRTGREFLALTAVVLEEEYRFSPTQSARWTTALPEIVERALHVQERFDRMGVTLLTANDAAYPNALEEIFRDAPGVLWLYGNARLFQAPTFTVLSSRGAAPSALERLDRLVEEGVLEGEVLVTGTGTPEYQRAAVVPLRYGAPRMVVLDRGLFVALGDALREEPGRASRIWRDEFDPNTDVALSAIDPDQPYRRGANTERDTLIAGLSRRLDFVHIGRGGTMDKLARASLKAGRAVRVVDGFAGSREWERYGAAMLPP